MKWIFALNEPDLVHSARNTYEVLAKTAVKSALKNAPGLEPLMIYNGKKNDFTSELADYGVEVICHRLSFQDCVDSASERSDSWKQAAKGAFLRLDIPSLLSSDDIVLYTDVDVIFRSDPSAYRFETALFAASSEFQIDDFKKINTGSMVINLKTARLMFPKLIEWTIENINAVPDFDQGALQMFFAGRWDRLDPIMNWKPYWGRNDRAIIVHFHGPKPMDFEPYSLKPSFYAEVYHFLYNKAPVEYREFLREWFTHCHS